MIRRNPGLKLFSIVLAILLWYSITKTERDAERIIELPISLRKVPEDLTVTNPPTKGVTVTLRGPRTLLDNVDQMKSRLQMNLQNLQVGDNRIDLNGTMVMPDLPRSLKAIRFDPASFTILADRRALRRLPVKADLAGQPPTGYIVAESTVVPNVVEVTGPVRVLEGLKEVTTEPIDMREATDTVQRAVRLEHDREQSLTFVPDVVRVTVTLEEVQATRDFAKVVVPKPEGVREIYPPSVDVTVRGPQALLHNLKLSPDAVTIDPSGLPPGTHSIDVIVNLPDGLKLVSVSPPRVRVKIGGKS
jgi:YbbR domain-containing protein